MAYLLDSNIAIYLREGVTDVVQRVELLPRKPFLCVITRIELEGGVYANPELRDRRRRGVDALLQMLPMVDFDVDMSAAYGQILESNGFNRRKIIDRMIAATAIVGGMTLVTTNGADFEDIEGLDLEVWNL